MTDKLPWMPFFGSDFYHDEAVRLMSLEEEAVYMRLLWWQWREGSLPADPEHMAKLAGASVSAQVMGRFPVTRDADGRRRNPRLDEIRRDQLALIEARSLAGKAGRAKQIRTKRQARPGQSPGKAQAEPGHTESYTEIEERKALPRARRPTDVVLPPGYLDAACKAWEKSRGVPNRGLIGKVHKPLVRDHGPLQVELTWAGYLHDRQGKEFCHPVDFATNYEIYRRKWAVVVGEMGEDIPVPDEPVEVPA